MRRGFFSDFDGWEWSAWGWKTRAAVIFIGIPVFVPFYIIDKAGEWMSWAPFSWMRTMGIFAIFIVTVSFWSFAAQVAIKIAVQFISNV